MGLIDVVYIHFIFYSVYYHESPVLYSVTIAMHGWYRVQTAD